LRRLREERLAEERAMRSQEREIRRKKEYFKIQEEQRLLKIQEEEEARKREGGYSMFMIYALILLLKLVSMTLLSCKYCDLDQFSVS
jgi:hypothetical protein